MANIGHLDPVFGMFFDQVDARYRDDAEYQTDDRGADECFDKSFSRHRAR